MARPAGVSAVVWLAVIGGALALTSAILAILELVTPLAFPEAGAAGRMYGPDGGLAIAGAVALAVLAWLALLGVLEIMVGIGVWRVKPWAWTLGVAWAYTAAASNLLGMFASNGSRVGAILGIGVAVAVLHYLYSDEVKAAFGKRESPTPAFVTALANALRGSR